jgi:hypothetical protein
VTALLHGGRDPSIGCMVVDSPFSNLRVLALELVGKFTDRAIPKVCRVACTSPHSARRSDGALA